MGSGTCARLALTQVLWELSLFHHPGSQEPALGGRGPTWAPEGVGLVETARRVCGRAERPRDPAGPTQPRQEH